jgi:N-methylhydantoinase A
VLDNNLVLRDRKFALGIDIGGTFTDGVLIEESTGVISIDKVPTTPSDLSEGFLHSLQRLAKRAGVEPPELKRIIHASTVATNAVLERRGARVGMLVTQGFRDILEIGRQIRHELYNLQTDKPLPLIPRQRCVEVPERLDYRGRVIVPLDKAAVANAALIFGSLQVDSIAICFLHSYQNSAHEQLAARIIGDLCPQFKISLSSEIAPEIREYWRASTVATNAYVVPIVDKYLSAIEEKLHRAGIATNIQVMQSNGGIMGVAMAKERPIYMLESGPAAGVTAASYFAELTGFPSAISFDMGGTTAKMGLILDSKPRFVTEFEAGSISGTGAGLAKGSGYPILAPVMDLVEVGTGGGSLAWIDSGGLMRVGPRSAGAVPGPACYGKGGHQPTITDANLLLGRLNPDYFLGGEIRLQIDAAQEAISSHCARRLSIDDVQAAMGIVDIANAKMAEAMRLVSVQRGYDPRDFCLVAFGGAGPLHANFLADELGIPAVVIPPSPGVISALGMVLSDLRQEYRVTHLKPLPNVHFEELIDVYRQLETRAFAALTPEAVTKNRVAFERYLDMRYLGQSWKLRIPLSEEFLAEASMLELPQKFHLAHEQSYGYCVIDESIELVNVGLVAVLPIPRPHLKEVESGNRSPAHAQKGARPVYFREARGAIDCPIFDRYALRHNNRIVGPAVIEEIDSTIVVHPHYLAEVGSFGIILLRRAESA